MSKSSATARVQITLEITPSGGGWGPECRVGQVHQQALESVERELDFLLAICRKGFSLDDGITRRVNARVIGRPRVLAVIVADGEP